MDKTCSSDLREHKIEIKKQQEAPRDPKPEVLKINEERTEHVRSSLIQRISDTTQKPKKRWRRSIDYSDNLTKGLDKSASRTTRMKSAKLSAVTSPTAFIGTKTSGRNRSVATRMRSDCITKTCPSLEAISPGVGAKVMGTALKRVT